MTSDPAKSDPATLDWSKAARLSQWYTVDGYPTRRRLEGRLFHDGTRLYIRLTERIDASWLVSEKAVFTGDDWEVFLAARRTPPYYQFAINPDEKLYTSPNASDLRLHVRAVSKVESSQWTFCLTIPLGKAVPNTVLEPGMSFCANFYRAVGSSGELLAWQPNFVRRFHQLDRMGTFILE